MNTKSNLKFETQKIIIVAFLALLLLASSASAGNTFSNIYTWVQGVYFDNTNNVVDFNSYDINDVKDVKTTGTLVNISGYDASLKLYSESHTAFGNDNGESIEFRGLDPTAKPFLGWYHWDEATQQYRGVGWFGCHYNLTNGNVHSHCSFETLDNSSGTPTLNTHFEITYNGSQTRADVKFPTSDVVFISNQKQYFGDIKQASIMHNGTTGKLELDANADILLKSHLDMEGNDLENVDDILSSASVDLKPATTTTIYPQGQTSRGLRINDDGANIEISALGTSTIDILDNFDMNSKNITDVDYGFLNAIKFVPTASPPVLAVEGMTYADTSHALCYYNSTGWEVIAGSGTCA